MSRGGQAAAGRSRGAKLSSSSHDDGGRFSFFLFISPAQCSHLEWYCCGYICVCAGPACPFCSVQTSHGFILWPSVHLLLPALLLVVQSCLLRADPYICDNTALFSLTLQRKEDNSPLHCLSFCFFGTGFGLKAD